MRLDKFILDANIFITPYRSYYPFDLARGFWEQMEKCLKREDVILLDVVSSEIKRLEDDLSRWLGGIENNELTSVKTPEIIQRYAEVLTYLQEAKVYKEAAFRSWASNDVADGWIVAAAMTMDATIITTEAKSGPIDVRNPSKNAKIPDVAEYFGIRCENLFYFMRQMNFKL